MSDFPSFLPPFFNSLSEIPLLERTDDKVMDMFADLYIKNEKTCGMSSEQFLKLLEEIYNILKELNMIVTTVDFMADALYNAMSDGKLAWGDLMAEYEAAGGKMKPKKVDKPEPLPEDWDLEFPVLKLRKDIWENFPVQCQPLGRGSDGAERHAIVWHRKNFSDWREACEDYFEAMDYEEITLYRLFKCLEASKHWTVEPAMTSQQICVIRMNFSETPVVTEASVAETPVPAGASAPIKPVVSEAPKLEAAAGWSTVGARKPSAAADAPVLTRINDITAQFPVVWNNESRPKMSARPGDIISISVFNKKLREMPPAAAEACLDRLMRALRASPAWRVIRGMGSEFCRLEMS